MKLPRRARRTSIAVPSLDSPSAAAEVFCPHVPDCAGCAFIGVAYTEQLRRKRERVQAACAAYPRVGHLTVPPVIGSPRAFGYRNQAKLVVRRARRGLLLGLYRPGSHQVVDIGRCPVHHPLINPIVEHLRAMIERYALSVYDERTGTGAVRYVVVRVSQWRKQAQVIVVTRARVVPRLREFVAAVRRHRAVVSVVQNVNPHPGNVIFGPQFVPLTRAQALIERVGPLSLKTHAGTFLQANVPVARKLYEQAVRWAAPAPDEVCVDLYCGAGALSFYLAATAKLVLGIEESASAVADAKENIRLNGFHNVRFDAGSAAERLTAVRARLPRLDVVTLNPPRQGADEATRAAIVASAPTRIVYISCDPLTLARDLEWFAAAGYGAVHIQPFDLLPQTDHVECVAALVRSEQTPRQTGPPPHPFS